MNDFRIYLEYSEKYLDIAKAKEDKSNNDWLLIPATILAWSSIESFVNGMIEDFSAVPPDLFELHERALLLEKKVIFIDSGEDIGKFNLGNTEYRRLEDKIFFLITKFARVENTIKKNKLWHNFQDFKLNRDKLVHPRKNNPIELNSSLVEEYINTSKEIITFISKHVWGNAVSF